MIKHAVAPGEVNRRDQKRSNHPRSCFSLHRIFRQSRDGGGQRITAGPSGYFELMLYNASKGVTLETMTEELKKIVEIERKANSSFE
jgi:hypothetical protein